MSTDVETANDPAARSPLAAASPVFRRPVKILVLVSADHVEAGPVKGCLQFIRHMSGPVIAFHLVNFRDSATEARAIDFAAGAAAAGVPVEFVTHRRRAYGDAARQLAALIRREGIDIVQSHGFKPAALCAWLRWRLRVPWVCFVHGTTTEDLRVRVYHAVEATVRLFADRVVLVADAQRGGSLQRFAGNRTRVIHNAVDTDHPVRMERAPGDVRKALGLSGATRLVVAVGRLSPEKGIDVLLDALARMPTTRHEELHLAIVGDGPERGRLEAQVSRLGLTRGVSFVGHVSTPGDYLRAADLVVLPSRSEGIPNVALEAMALGRPLVATAVGGTPEVVVGGRAGLLVPPADSAALAAAIERVLREPDLAADLARGARAHAIAELSVATRCARLRSLYAELVPGRFPPAGSTGGDAW